MYPSKNQIDQAAERIIEVLLEEELGRVVPPDQTDIILSRLAVQAEDMRSRGARSRSSKTEVDGYGRLTWLAGALLAIAASGLVAIVFLRTRDNRSGRELAVSKDATGTSYKDVDVNEPLDPVAEDPLPADATPIRSNPRNRVAQKLEVAITPHVDSPFKSSQDVPALSPKPSIAKMEDDAIVLRINQLFEELWREEGLSVNPADPVVAIERLQKLTTNRQISHVSLASVRASAAQLAAKWVSHLVRGQRLFPGSPDGSTDAAVAGVAILESAFSGQKGWDQILREMLRNHQDRGEWFGEVGQGDVTGLVGKILFNEEFTCSRCHDDPLNSQRSQREYWGLAAIFRPPSASGNVEPLYYQTLDGLTRVATPSLPKQIFRTNEPPRPEDVIEVAIQSGGVAQASANLLWSLVFRRPLMGVVADPSSPPVDSRLEQIHRLLSEQMIAYDYDLGRALTWIVRSRPFQTESMSVPGLALTSQQWELRERRERLFGEFPFLPAANFSKKSLMELASRWTSQDSIDALAQVAPGRNKVDGKGSRLNAAEEQLRTTFPVRRSGNLAEWLEGIEDFSERARHLFYLAGIPNPSSRDLAWCNQLREENRGDSQVALHQIWWVLRP